ncbi:MAG TPA: hypothetical protein ACHBX0_07570 [Arsenophonus sp.]
MSYDNTINAHRSALAYLDLDSSEMKLSTATRQFNISQIPLAPATNVTQWLDLEVKKGDLEVSKPLDLGPVIEQRINQSKQYYDQAKQQGIEIVKRSFFKELLNVGIAGGGLGLSLAATLLTGGATIPLLIVSSVTFGLAVADAGCAYVDWHSKAKGGEGLKLGADSIVNGICLFFNKVGMASGSAENWAKYTSALLRAGLAVSTLCTSGPVTAATLGKWSSLFATTKFASSCVDMFASRTAAVTVDNATEQKILLQEKQLQQKQALNKLEKIRHRLSEQQREQQDQLNLQIQAELEQTERQASFKHDLQLLKENAGLKKENLQLRHQFDRLKSSTPSDT